MNKRSMDSMKKELIEIIKTASPKMVDDMIVALHFFKNATPAEMAEFRKQMDQKDFDVNKWLESIKAKTISGAAPAALEMEAVQYAK